MNIRSGFIQVLVLVLIANTAVAVDRLLNNPRELGPVALKDLAVSDGKVIIRVASNGGTDKAAIRANVREQEGTTERMPHYVVTFERIRVDDNKAFLPNGIVLEYDVAKDLGLPANATLTVTNQGSAQFSVSSEDDALLRQDLLAENIAAEEPQADVKQTVENQIRTFPREQIIVVESDPQETQAVAPKLAKLLPLKDTRVYGLSDFLADPKVRGASARLVAGIRPADDIPPVGCQVTGRRLTEIDWLLQQENAAIWVTGTTPPAVGVPLVVIGTFIENQHGSHLHATLVCRDFGPLKTPKHTLRPGEFLFLALVDARSAWDDLAVVGDSVRVIGLGRAAVAFEALRPGTTGVTVIQHQSGNEHEPRTVSQFEIQVQK